MNSAAGFVNMTANFSTDKIDLTKVNGTAKVSLVLRAEPETPADKYIIAVSATDGTVTRSTYFEMIVVEK